MPSKKRQQRQLRRRKRMERHDADSVMNKTNACSSGSDRHSENSASRSANESASGKWVSVSALEVAAHRIWTRTTAKGAGMVSMTHRWIDDFLRSGKKNPSSLVWAATILLASVLIGNVEYLRRSLLSDTSVSLSSAGIVVIVGSVSVLLPIVLLLLVWNAGVGTGDGKMRRNKEAESEGDTARKDDDEWMETIRPLGLRHDSIGDCNASIRVPELAASERVRTKLAEWLPFGLRHTSDLRLVYTTSVDGRSLPVLYHRLEETGSRHTLLLAEVASSSSSSPPPSGSTASPRCIVGMYASHRWHSSARAYGDGQSFLFRIGMDIGMDIGIGADHRTHTPSRPNATTSTRESPSSIPLPPSTCWHWSPPPASGANDSNRKLNVNEHGHEPEPNTTRDNDPAAIRIALWETFQRSNQTSLSMGIGYSGIGAGLRLSDNLTLGESHRAVGFDNEPLVTAPKTKPTTTMTTTVASDHKLGGSSSSSNHHPSPGDCGVVFDVGLVEVYQLVREIDGRPIQ